MTKHDFADRLAVDSPTTAEILDRLRDHLPLLQSFVWQEYGPRPDSQR